MEDTMEDIWRHIMSVHNYVKLTKPVRPNGRRQPSCVSAVQDAFKFYFCSYSTILQDALKCYGGYNLCLYATMSNLQKLCVLMDADTLLV